MIGLSRISGVTEIRIMLKKKMSGGENEKFQSSWFLVFQISLYLLYVSTEGHNDLTMGQLKTNFR